MVFPCTSLAIPITHQRPPEFITEDQSTEPFHVFMIFLIVFPTPCQQIMTTYCTVYRTPVTECAKLHISVCVFQCQPTALLRTSGSTQGRWMALSVVYFRITHCLGRPHYVWDEYLYRVLEIVRLG